MSIIGRVATPYILPFPVLIEPAPLFSRGGPVAVRIDLPAAVTDKAIDMLDSFVDSFCVLGSTGALGGDTVPPWLSTINDKGTVNCESQTASWLLEGVNTDERALVMLVNLFLSVHEKHPIEQVKIGDSTAKKSMILLPEDPGLQDPYPPRWPSIRFRVNLEPFTTDTRTLSIVFQKNLSGEEAAYIETELLSWSAAPTVGAYAVAPISPMSSYLIPSPSVDIVGNELTWGLEKIRMHAGALDGLINVCVAIDHNLAVIDELRLSG